MFRQLRELGHLGSRLPTQSNVNTAFLHLIDGKKLPVAHRSLHFIKDSNYTPGRREIVPCNYTAVGENIVLHNIINKV